jgi:hypothetical protein
MSVTAQNPEFTQTPASRLLEPEPFVVQRVRLRCALRAAWMRALWGKGPGDTAQGMAIPHAEVDRILSDPAESAEAMEEFLARDPQALHLSEDLRTLEKSMAADASLQWLQREFGLSGAELDLLALCAAVEIDPALRKVCGYLHDDAAACYPTAWLGSLIFNWDSRPVMGSDSALVKWRMARPLEGHSQPWSMTAPWTVDPHMTSWFLQKAGLDPALSPAARYVPAAESASKLCLYPGLLSEIREFMGAMEKGRAAFLLELVGPARSGKKTLASQFSALLGTGLLAVDASALLALENGQAPAEKMLRVVRMARLSGSILYWHGVEGVPPSFWEASEGLVRFMILGVRSPLAFSSRKPLVRRALGLPSLTPSLQAALWEKLAGTPAPEPVTQWVMTPGDMVNAAHAMSAGPEAVLDAFRGSSQHGSSELFTHLACPFTWDDIILSPANRDHLGELEQQARLRPAVYEDWGFRRLCPMGRGITAMFAGPSGTGKTMAAQVLARSLGMELYRVDLAGVMNKYIGETEKRLKQVFDISEKGNTLLFFDEADALFGQRTQVKDAHDRFANIEIDYLLQRMEQFDGIAILATNRKSDLDKAFLRRIRFIVDFLPPGPGERLAIWHRVLPEKSPGGEPLLGNINWDFLATKLNMTGADITAAALSAAFIARSEGGLIGMKQVLHAARREMSKQGVGLRPGDWSEGL